MPRKKYAVVKSIPKLNCTLPLLGPAKALGAASSIAAPKASPSRPAHGCPFRLCSMNPPSSTLGHVTRPSRDHGGGRCIATEVPRFKRLFRADSFEILPPMTLRGGVVMPTQTHRLPSKRALTRIPLSSGGLLFGLIAVLMAAPACAPPPQATTASPRRVVALAPAVTAVVYGLGQGDSVVGVCGQCDYPPTTRDLPRVGGYLAPSVEAVLAVRPDLVLVVPSPGNREAVRTLERAGIRILVTADRTLDDLWSAIDSIACALGVPEHGAALRASPQQQLDAGRNRVAGLPATRVLLVVGHRPLIVAGGGTLQDELLRVPGGVNVAGDTGAAFPQVPIELVVARAPEVILDAAMGSEAGGQELFEGLRTVPAVRDGRIVPLAADAIFRAGPRVGEAAALLASAIHPGTAAGS